MLHNESSKTGETEADRKGENVMVKSEIYEAIRRTATCMTTLASAGFHEYCPVSNIDIDKWEWPQGVGMYALYRYSEQSGDREMLRWLFEWYDRHLEQQLPEKNINTTAPMLALTYLYEICKKESYLKVIQEWAEAVMRDFARTEEGGFQHSGSGVNDLYGQLWDDTLMMTCLFLGRAGILSGKKEYLEECERQFLLHTKYLCDRKTGLWYHGWTFEGRHNFGKGLWGRGNAWISVVLADFLEYEGLSGAVRMFLKETLLSQAKTLAKYQDESGMWHTLIDDPSSYPESSATAGLGYGILKGVRMGYLPKEYREVGRKAAEAILERIGEDGAVADVSYGTNVGNTPEDYKNIPICVMPYGQALAILLLTEAAHIDL